ncbi:MAG: hypothetical protein IJ326_11090 [Lachnospiraceae bacterium]|nr:hypothetical protein [Lachnospiraceae bacterium]
MTEKQYRKADKFVMATLLVVSIGILLNMLGMMSSKIAGANAIIVVVISLLAAVVTIVAYQKKKGTQLCGMIMSGATTIAWAAMVILIDAQFFYMLGAPLLVAQMAYLDKKRVIATSAIELPIFTIKSMMLSGKGEVSATEAGTSVVLLILIIVAVYMITKIWIAFNSENLDTVRHVSEELVTHFDGANKYIKTLDEALNKCNVSMQEIAANIESTATEMQTQSLKCQDIEDNVRMASDQTDGMATASRTALEEVALGAEAMDKLHNHSQEVESDNKQTVEYVVALNDRTKAVQNILGTIASISTQTHLLSLNASIEAARAGEAGKGFAVVADEIRGLAEQTKVATEEITEILGELNHDVKRVTKSINHSVETVGEQNKLIEETKGKFDAIDNGVMQLMENMNDFRRVIADITHASEVIADGITELSANSQEVAAAADDGTHMMTKAVDDMNQVKAILNDIYDMAQNLRNEYIV